MLKPELKCWICGGDATTGEHKTKRTDLRSVLGIPTQGEPFYYHDAKKPNQLVRSLDAKILKSPSRICADCNSAGTQPHDRAWEQMSEWLRSRNPPVKPGDIVRANRIFPYDTAREMLNVHLFFLKQFGGLIMESEGKVPIPVTPFADAIKAERAHPNVYLQFGCGYLMDGKPVTGRSNVHALKRNSDGECVFATWYYQFGGFTVSVTYGASSETWNLSGFWHPRFGTNRLTMVGFKS